MSAELTKIATESLDKALETFADSAVYLKFLKEKSAFHAYSWTNMFWLFAQNPEITQVGGKTRWDRLGRAVKPEEEQNGLMILMPRFYKKDEKGEDGKPKKGMYFTTGKVWDYSQTIAIRDDAWTPENVVRWMPKGETDQLPSIERAVLNDGVPFVTYHDHLGGAGGRYNTRTKNIEIVLGDTAQMASVLLHEWAHHRIHDDKKYTYAQEEVIVESISYVVRSVLGIPDTTDYASFVYITNWLQKNPKSFKTALNTVHSEAKKMIDLITEGAVA